MTIESKDWTARQVGTHLYVAGTVKVVDTSIEPVLELSKIQDKSANLDLDLKLQALDVIALHVMVNKQVTFETTMNYTVPVVHINHDSGPVTSIGVTQAD